ncbi:hypothetical protein [Polaromonas sp.]|uniref:hypothetical protein n=1 Tax=Polaromonas sp. TaxID=1869339 RepID=UPI00352B1785
MSTSRPFLKVPADASPADLLEQSAAPGCEADFGDQVFAALEAHTAAEEQRTHQWDAPGVGQ